MKRYAVLWTGSGPIHQQNYLFLSSTMLPKTKQYPLPGTADSQSRALGFFQAIAFAFISMV
jgi:hypothetical protein